MPWAPLQAAWAVVKGFLDLAASILRLIPWWVYFWLFIGSVVWAVFHGEVRHRQGFVEGQSERQALWDAASTEQEKRIRELEDRIAVATSKVDVQVIERVRTVHEKGSTIIQKVPEYIPAGACDLPPGFRVLHDAAARNEVPNAP